MAKAFIASDRSPCVLAALLCACALGCNTFDDPGDHDGEVDPPTATFGPPRVTLPPIMTPGTGVATSPPDVAPPNVGTGMVPCVPCGMSCVNCGDGCTCEPSGVPDKDEWLSPFSGNGGDGWRDSSAPLCSGLSTVWGTDIARDGGTVYVMVHGMNESPGGVELADADGGTVHEQAFPFVAQRTRVLQNDGSGWTFRAELIGMGAGQQLKRMGSSLLIYGNVWQGRDEACSLGMLIGDRFQCEDLGNVQDVHPVNDSSAFALANGTDLFAFDGSTWRQLPDKLNNLATSIWADDHEVVVGAGGGKVGWRGSDEDTWSFVDVGVDMSVTALWGTSGDDLWAGDLQSHLLHFDGTRWSTIADLHQGSSCTKRAPILGIVGAGSNVWAYTESQLARWDGEKLEAFGNWTCAAMEGASGERIDRVVSAGGDGLFIAISNTLEMRACGASFVVHYDGKKFHRF